MDNLDKIASPENLKLAFRHVAANRGCPGADGVSLEAFEETLDERVREISRDLLASAYRFDPAMSLDLEKRTVYVLTARDRTVSQAAAQILSGPLEKCFHPASYAYRPGRSAVQATSNLQAILQKRKAPWVLRCDVYHFFDEIRHSVLDQFLEWSLGEGERALELLKKAARQPVLREGQLSSPDKGICQGASLSPLLSNLYLTPLDRFLEKSGLVHFRFCDDIAAVVDSRAQGESAHAAIEEFLRSRLGLRLRQDKKQIVPFSDGFDFLGFSLSARGRFPGASARERLNGKLAETGDENARNQVVRQWEAYFGKGASETPGKADSEPANQDDRVPATVRIFLDLFRGNPGSFAEAWGTPNRYGYSETKGPLAAQDVLDHFLGRRTLAVYPLIGEAVNFTCLDFDLAREAMSIHRSDPADFAAHRDGLLQHARRIQRLLRNLGWDTLFEDSGYKGFHLWLFFREPAPASRVLALWQKIFRHVGRPPAKTRRETFPRESNAEGGEGSCIKLPLGIHPCNGRRSMFLDDAGEPIANPASLLAGVRKIAAAELEAALSDSCSLPEPNSPLDLLTEGCNVVRALCRKAETQKDLAHVERLILLYTLAQFGEEGERRLHRVLANCANYDYGYTQRQIEKKKPSPMGCRRIQEIMGDALEEIECRCVFDRIPNNGYASPILHVYPNGTRNLGGRKPRT